MKTKEFNDKFVPEVRILFSDLLYYGESQILAKHYEKTVEPKEYCITKISKYREEWQKRSNTILLGMQDIYKLNFYRPVIEATMAPFFAPMSMPLLMNFRPETDSFVDVLTHELFHILFNDNHLVNYQTGENLLELWRNLFGQDIESKILVHIMVHSGLKEIYLDVLKEPYRLERDIKECQQWPAYKAAWAYVEDNDYKEINKKIKELYKSNF